MATAVCSTPCTITARLIAVCATLTAAEVDPDRAGSVSLPMNFRTRPMEPFGVVVLRKVPAAVRTFGTMCLPTW